MIWRQLTRVCLFNGLAFGLLLCAGCGNGVTTRSEPVEFTVNVTSGGKPVSGINLGLSPMDAGLPSGVTLKGGTGQGRAVPGKYMYFAAFGDAKDKDAVKLATEQLQAIPEQFHKPDEARSITISSGATIEVKLD